MATEKAVLAVIKAARPAFGNKPHDKVAFAIHAAFQITGYSLVAVGRSALSDPPPSGEEEVDVDGWNEMEDCYGFIYFKEEKGVKWRVIVKALVIMDLLAVDVLDLERQQNGPFHQQINVKELVSDADGDPRNYNLAYRNLKALVDCVNDSFLDKLEGVALLKFGASSSTSSGRPESNTDETAAGAYANPAMQPYGIVCPPIPQHGYDDISPGGGAGFYPSRGVGPGGSMLIGPNDPRFFPSGRPDYPGGLGGDLPSRPPGSRFDPIGPPDVPGFEPSRFVRRPRAPGHGVHPDLQFFQHDHDFI